MGLGEGVFEHKVQQTVTDHFVSRVRLSPDMLSFLAKYLSICHFRRNSCINISVFKN